MNYLNIPDISPSKFQALLDHLIQTGIPAMLWGPPGCGKSMLVKQYAEAKGYGLTVKMIAQMLPTDFIIPYVDQERGIAKSALANFLAALPTDQPHILFLDEINAAPADVQTACYQLILDHRLGEYEIPKSVYIMAAGNRPEDGALASAMNTAISDRLQHYSIQPDAEEWTKWAVNNEIHPFVTTFIKVKPEYLAQSMKQQASAGDVLVVPTPRSWERVSNILKMNMPAASLEYMLAGTVGSAVTATFKSTLEQLQNLAPVEDYFRPNLKPADISGMMPSTITGLYGLAYSMASYITAPEQYVHALGVFKIFTDNSKKTKLPVGDVFVTAASLFLQKARDNGVIVNISIDPNFTTHIFPILMANPMLSDLAKAS